MALLDQYGQPVRIQSLPKRQAEPGLAGVRQIWAMSQASGLTPQRLAAILRDCDAGHLEDYLVLAEEMEERDPHYFSVMGQRKRAVSGVAPTVTPASDDAKDRKIAEAVTDRIAGHDGFSDLIEDLMDAVGKGFAVAEIVWARSASRWWPEEFVRVDPRFFKFDDRTGREIRLRDETNAAEGIPLEPFKFVRHQPRQKAGLVFRGGLARVVAFSWMCKAYAQKDWMAFIETYGLPLRLGRYGPEANAQDVQKLFQAVANIGTDAAAVLPESMRIEFQEAAKGTASDMFERLARYLDEQVSKAVIGQTMTADNGSSQSQANVHNEVRHDIAMADARALSATLMRDVVKPFVDLNFGVQDVYPRLSIDISEPEDVAMVIDKALALVDRGIPLRAAELRSRLRLGEPKEGDEIAVARKAPATDPAARNRIARNRAGDTGGDAIDEIEREMMAEWEEVMGDVVAPVEAAIAGATDYEDAMRQLDAAMPGMSSGKLIDALVRGMFKARGLGDARDG